jgi:hypothetical protein
MLRPELTDAELRGCVSAAAQGGWSVPNAGPVLLVFASHLTSPWLLGMSAALHQLPLVIAGLGTTGTPWPWFQGAAAKLPASQRAAQLLQRLTDSPVALLDSFDTFIANAPSKRGPLPPMDDGTVVLGSECNHYPVCRIPEFRQLDWYHACLADGYNACAPNGGFMLGRPRALHKLLGAVIRTVLSRSVDEGPERFTSHNDQVRLVRRQLSGSLARAGSLTSTSRCQAALQQLLIGGGAGVRLRVDRESRHILNTYACATRANVTRR